MLLLTSVPGFMCWHVALWPLGSSAYNTIVGQPRCRESPIYLQEGSLFYLRVDRAHDLRLLYVQYVGILHLYDVVFSISKT